MVQQLQLEVGSESKDSFKKTEFFPVLRDAIWKIISQGS